MGRKPGICLFAVSQSGTTDVFDAHVRKNMKNVLLFQSEHTVNEMWRVDIRLAELPIGAAYSVRHAAVVQFPQARRPLLAAPGWPVRDTGIPAFSPAEEPVPAGIPVFGTDQTLDYTPEQVAHIRRLHAELGSLKAVQRKLYGQEGGYWFYRIRAAVEG